MNKNTEKCSGVTLFVLIVMIVQASGLQAQTITYPDQQEIVSLAKNIDKAIQACGRHVSASESAKGQKLVELGFDLTDDAPEDIKKLASFSTFGISKYHHWIDPHAEIWLIASQEKPSCRIAVSNSDWFGEIDPKLSELIQVGNFWRPAREGEVPIPKNAEGPMIKNYVMDLPARFPFKPVVIVTTAKSDMILAGGQQMIITLLRLTKE